MKDRVLTILFTIVWIIALTLDFIVMSLVIKNNELTKEKESLEILVDEQQEIIEKINGGK